jgi:hypothetical protein
VPSAAVVDQAQVVTVIVRLTDLGIHIEQVTREHTADD